MWIIRGSFAQSILAQDYLLIRLDDASVAKHVSALLPQNLSLQNTLAMLLMHGLWLLHSKGLEIQAHERPIGTYPLKNGRS